MAENVEETMEIVVENDNPVAVENDTTKPVENDNAEAVENDDNPPIADENDKLVVEAPPLPPLKVVDAKSSTIQDKFKRYVSEADMLMLTLNAATESVVAAPEDECDSNHLLLRNTESFQCLAQLLLSSSSIMKNRLFLFPPLEDPGIDIAFSFEEPPFENDDIGIAKYKKLCREMDIVPISRIINSLETDTLNLKYYGLTAKQITAFTEALKANMHVQTLILQDNWLTPEMTQMISDMISENTSLQYVSLQECRIGEEGAQKLGEVLASLQTLKTLNLSFNDLGDRGLLALQGGLSNNTSLKTLNLSHNNFTEDSGEVLEKILLENKSLEELDLSWNGFYTAQGNRKLFLGLMNSDRIKILNLAWNGLGLSAAVRPLTRYLRMSTHLEELDLSNNRLEGQSLRMTRTAINKNHSLQMVKIGNNIYAPQEAHFLLTMLAGKSKDPLYYLDMENMYVNKESKPVLMKIKTLGKTVKIGGILSNYEIHGPDPHKLLYERCRYILNKPKKAKARKDFGHFVLSLPETPIGPEDFQKMLKKMKMKKLDKDLVQSIINLFLNKKNQVECCNLLQDYMNYYPDAKLPPPKPKKSKKGKKGKKGKKKQVTTEEKEIQVHDLEQKASQTDATNEPPNEIVPEQRKSKLSLSASRANLESPSRTLVKARGSNVKSVTILPHPSIIPDNPNVSPAEAGEIIRKSIIKNVSNHEMIK